MLESVFSRQAIWCKSLGSPLYARIATACAHLVTAPSAVAGVLGPHRSDPYGSLLPLRFLGALHRLALSGEAPELARHYPSCGGDGDAAAAAAAIEGATNRLRDRIETLLPLHPQTNEVGRAAAILGGFIDVARRTRLPLRVLEIGASAGLNLRFDHFRYACGAWQFGSPGAEVVLDANFEAPLPFDGEMPLVAERRGCDLLPVDAATEAGLLHLRSFVWPDQLQRLALLAAAATVARRVEAIVDREGAASWLERQLAVPQPGVATVVYHTVVMQYLTDDDRAAVAATLARAARAATADAPLAHLSLEPRTTPNVVLRRFPGDAASRAIANATMHGRDVRWLAT